MGPVSARCWLLLALLLSWAVADPVSYPESRLPLSAVSDISARLGGHLPRVGALGDRDHDARFPLGPLPTIQDIEAIKKVAQILITLGQQVIPAIIGEPAPMDANCDSAPDDVVAEEDSP